jgi:stress response protein SCP2
MSGRILAKGENMPLPSNTARLQVLLGWQETDRPVDLDASALLLGRDRRVLSDADFVFYNQPDSPDGAARHQGRASTETGAEERIAIDLGAARGEVDVIALTASVYAGSFGQVDALQLLVLDASGEAVAQFAVQTATSETALLVAEVYRRGEAWKLRAVGQGWDNGLAGLVTEFGVCVDSDDGPGDDGPGDDGLEADAGTHTREEAAAETPRLVPAAGPDTAAGVEPSGHEDDLVEVSGPDLVAPAGPPLASGPAGKTPPVPGGERPPDASDATAPVEAASVASLAATANATAGTPGTDRPRRGVRTRKSPARSVPAPTLQLAGDEGWQSARLFSIYSIGATAEQEQRATSALLAVMMAVRPFGRALSSRFGAPAGNVETYLEVGFPAGETTAHPDGVIRVARAGRIWTGLLETKTGTGQLRRDQVETYLDVARSQGFDAVITLSNEIAPAIGEHPVQVDKRKLRKVELHHVSWAEVLHEAKMTLTHRGIADPLQAWLLAELIRYLEHPRSGACGFEDMGPGWVSVREAVAAGTVRANDRKVPAVADAWIRLVRQICLRLTAELGVKVTHVLPRKLATNPSARTQAVIAGLVSRGSLDATIRVPEAAGSITVIADLRTAQVRTGVTIAAPAQGTNTRRVNWMLRQLKEAPDDLTVEVTFAGRCETTCERLKDVRDNSAALLIDHAGDVVAFTVTRTTPMGTKRSGVRGAFVPSVTSAAETYYADVVQPLRAWTPPAPTMPTDAVAAAEAAQQASAEAAQQASAEEPAKTMATMS